MSTFTIDMLAHPLPQANSAASIAALRYIFSANGLRESDSDVDEGLCIVQEDRSGKRRVLGNGTIFLTPVGTINLTPPAE